MQNNKQQFLSDVKKFLIYKCRENGNPITEALASFIVQTTINPQTNRFFLEGQGSMDQEEILQLKTYSYEKISDLNNLSVQTISLQISYNNSFFESELIRQDRIKNQSLETGKLIDEVVSLEIKNSKDFEGLALLYKKIFAFLLYKNKEIIFDQSILNSTLKNFNVEKEVAAALESVIPRAALSPFVSLNPSEKVTQLVELSNLVIGIRLFNKEIDKGGSSLASLQELINHQGRELPELLRQEAIEIVEKCDDYTTFFLQYELLDLDLTQNEFTRYKNELTFYRQYLSYILSLQDDIEVSENTIETNETRYQKEISELKHLLGHKSSAPKEQVYPKFATIAQAYISLIEEKKLYETRIFLYNILQESKLKIQTSLPKEYIAKAKQLQLQIQQTKPQDSPLNIDIDPNLGIERLLPNTTPDFMQTPLDFLGFCVWSLVEKDGLLIAGNPNLGVYKFSDKFCVFRDNDTIQYFLKHPKTYVEGVIEQCRKNPELIHLLRMEDYFQGLQLSTVIQVEGGGAIALSTKLMVDKEIETPIHFLEKNFDSNYCWNEWELRKKAIQMANIRKKQTQASQTLLTNFRADSDAQVWLKKDSSTNTGIHKGVNPIKPRNYIVGLRDKNTQ